MNPTQRGLARGREAGAQAKGVPEAMRAAFQTWRKLYPTATNIDFAPAIRDLDRERLACEPEYAKFPELRGHADLLHAEREGFRETSGLDETCVAFHYSGDFFMRRRLDPRHLARWDLMPAPGTACTGVYFPHGVEGVTMGQNYDVPLRTDMAELAAFRPEQVLRQDTPMLFQGGGSSAVLMDDEPKCSFPANPLDYDLMPPDCLDDIEEIVRFLDRYNEFWGPGNSIVADRHWNAVVVEKTNCLMAVRRPTVNGACAATACAYLDPKLSAHQLSRARKAMEMKGDTEATSLDLNFHIGAGKRYRRLIDLVEAEAKRGPTLWGTLDLISDHAVPYPDRICLAGESSFPDREKLTNWTVSHHASVVTGPNRRCLYRAVQSFRDAKPVYEYTPNLMLGPGVSMKPDWRADVNDGRCVLAPSVK